jgi:hypothetical protein
MSKGTAARTIYCALSAALVASCAGVPPLADVKLTQVSSADQTEVQRVESAQNLYTEQQKPRVRLHLKIIQPDWPWLWVTFESTRQIFNPLEAGQRYAAVYLCSLAGPDLEVRRLGWQKILWRGKIVGQEAAREIAEELKTNPGPQEYKVYFRYQNWDRDEPREEEDPITLVPLQEDLCLSLKRSSDPFPPSIGEPLRISKDEINAAVGELPRSLAVPKI